MKKIFNIFLAISFLFLTSLYAIIKETNSLEVLKMLPTGTTVVALDLDNNLVVPENEAGFGGEAWFSAMLRDGYSFQYVLPLYFSLQERVSLKLIDQSAVEIIRGLKKNGVIVIGLTSRSSEILHRTLNELRRLGIEFSKLKVDLTGKLNGRAIVAEGVAFCDQNDKGQVLKEIFAQMGGFPDNVVAMDDKEKYLQQIDAALTGQTRFYGYRNSVWDEAVATFDLNKANQYLGELGIEIAKSGSNI